MSFLDKLANKSVMSKVNKAIQTAYKQGRLKFIIGDDNKVEYTDKEGISQVFTIDELASHLWGKMNDEFFATTGQGLAALKVTPDDINKVIRGLR